MDSTTHTKPKWTSELWRPIPGYEDLYEVSHLGRIRRKTRTRKSQGRAKLGRKIIRPEVGRDFELYVRLWDHGKRQKFQIKKLVMLVFIRNYKYGKVYCKDGNNKNCHVNNLWEVGNNKKKKLTPEEILEVHERLKAGESGAHIARVFKLSRAAICIIKRKKRVRDQEEKARAKLDI